MCVPVPPPLFFFVMDLVPTANAPNNETGQANASVMIWSLFGPDKEHGERLDGLKHRQRALFIPNDLSPCMPPNPTEGRLHGQAASQDGRGVQQGLGCAPQCLLSPWRGAFH